MILDERTEFADAVSCNTGAAGTYNIGDVIDLSVARDIASGRPLYLVVGVDTSIITGGNAGTIAFQLVSDGTDTIATNGTATYTNNNLYASIKLVRVDCIGMCYASDTVTVKRVTAADTYRQTNTLVAVACSSNYGASNLIENAMILTTDVTLSNSTSYTSIPVYMAYGDVLTFTSAKGSNGYYAVEFISSKR